MTISSNAPGCFGSALAFQADHSFCKTCVFHKECEPLHVQNLAALRLALGVKVRAKKPAAAPLDRPLTASELLPTKVRELCDRLDRGNYNVLANLLEGINPFKQSPGYLKVACHLLIGMRNSFDRNFLSAAFVQAFGWQKNTADAHARMAFQALIHIGAVEDNDGSIQTKRS